MLQTQLPASGVPELVCAPAAHTHDPLRASRRGICTHGCLQTHVKDTALIKAAIFDVDGTLVDTNNLHVEAWREAGFTDDEIRSARELADQK